MAYDMNFNRLFFLFFISNESSFNTDDSRDIGKFCNCGFYSFRKIALRFFGYYFSFNCLNFEFCWLDFRYIRSGILRFFLFASSGFTPDPRMETSFFSKSNQKLDPNEIASAVMIKPKSINGWRKG